MKKQLNNIPEILYKSKKKLTLSILLFISFILFAQEPITMHLAEKEGVPDKEFYDIFEDDKGFIWLCADKGFFRYNGKEYKKYNNIEQRGLSVFGVQEDPTKRIWCNNISGQFFYVKGDKLTLFIDLNKQLKGVLAKFFVKKNYLWVFTRSNIYQINLLTKEIKPIIKARTYIGGTFSYNDAIYYQTIDSISKVTVHNKIKSFLARKLAVRSKKGKSIPPIKSISFKCGTDLFLMQENGFDNVFFKIDTLKKSIKIINGFDDINKYGTHTIFENDKEVWFGTNKGVWVYEYVKDRFQLKKHFLKDKNVTKILKDKDNNYWLTTLNSGIYLIPNIHIEYSNLLNINKNISSLDKLNDSTLVFGLRNGNIGFYNTNNYQSKIIKLPTEDRVSAIKCLSSNTILVSKDITSYVLDYKKNQYVKTDTYQSVKSFSIVNDNILAASSNTATLLKKSNIMLKRFFFQNKAKFISKGKRTYTSYYNEKKKEVYISYVDGLKVYDSTWKAKSIQYNNRFIYAKSITKTTNGVIWVGTFKDGIFGIKNNSVVNHYTTKSGLTSNNIEKIKADENTLWIATDNSIQKVDVTSLQFKKLTKKEGVPSYDISGIEFINDKVFFSSSEGLFSINKKKTFKKYHPEVYFNRFQVNEKDTLVKPEYVLNHTQNTIKIGFNVTGFLFDKNGKYKYRLKGINNNWTTTGIGVNTIKYNSLPSGEYTFQVQPYLEKHTQSSIKELKFTIKKAFWATWWFRAVIFFLLLGSIVLYYKKKLNRKEKERLTQLEKINLEKELISQNLTALRSQMNPHFIFNALNSIQDLVLKQDTDTSYDYIVLFAELIRNTLNYSSQDFIPIEKEIEFLNIYLQLEKLRFGDDFNYQISFTSNEALEVPSLLIQPFIENALVHGLMHKAGKKELSVLFNFTNESLQCVITDNGIGREKSKAIKIRQGNHHKSFALSSIKKRLEIFQKLYATKVGYVIEDLQKDNNSQGTRVIVSMPFKKLF
ncbi:hypothetical protein DS884_16370 [Tenacibaculum sp. E3R01]|uniref:sensor histidine kinase n=1 Tax=Tenacibaculum sp. E3R01 TaxID=2267227 RepID=UPI000DE820E2|nr:histidine kinase [Tenacibaculum sp. E3R01]RBW55204.1 hypothetical protein DS884_16370 [Tenacibaculum sp. E3R01]